MTWILRYEALTQLLWCFNAQSSSKTMWGEIQRLPLMPLLYFDPYRCSFEGTLSHFPLEGHHTWKNQALHYILSTREASNESHLQHLLNISAPGRVISSFLLENCRQPKGFDCHQTGRGLKTTNISEGQSGELVCWCNTGLLYCTTSGL